MADMLPIYCHKCRGWCLVRYNPDRAAKKLLGKRMLCAKHNRRGKTVHVCKFCKRSFRTPRPMTRIYCSINCRSYDQHGQVYMRRALQMRSPGSSPNRSEYKLGKMIKRFGYKFTGNGNKNCRIAGLKPDFTHKDRCLIVELFGERFHEDSDVPVRKKLFAAAGYKCLIIWYEEFASNPVNVIRKVRKFTGV